MINNFGESYFRYYEKMFYAFQRKALVKNEQNLKRKMRTAYKNCEICLRYLNGDYDASHIESLERMRDELKSQRTHAETDAQALKYAFAVCLGMA